MKNITIVAAYSTDLSLALQWLRFNKAVKKIGPINPVSNTYRVTIVPKKTFDKKKIKHLIKNKFGSFIKVL